MMKKNMLLAILAVGCVVSNCMFASEAKEDANSHAVLHFNDWYEPFDSRGHEHQINGVRVSDWIVHGKSIKAFPDQVFVVKKNSDGSFGEKRDITTFDQPLLCDINRNDVYFHWSGVLEGKYPKHLEEISLVQSLKKGTCRLCKFDSEQIIITGADGTPQQECEEYINLEKNKILAQAKKRAAIQAKADKIAQTSSRVYYAQKNKRKEEATS